MRPLNPYSLRKIVTIFMFTIFLASTVFFQNCGGPIDREPAAAGGTNNQPQR